MGSSSLLLLAAAAVVLLVFLVTWRQWNAFIALLAAALVVGCGVGCGVGFGPLATLKHFQDGLGATVGGIAAVIGLGAMLGKLLSESGAAEVLAARFSAFFGPKRVGWCVAALAVSVGLVTWFAVGLLLLLPVIATLSRETKRPFLMLAIPLLAFLSVMHGLMPPHPGPVTAIAALGANTGAVLGWGFLIGMPTAAVAGPLFARMAVKRVTAEAPVMAVERPVERPKPGFGVTLFVICLPVVLMLLATGAELWGHGYPAVFGFLTAVGHPVFALALAVVAAGFLFQRSCGFSRVEILKFTETSVASVGMSVLVIGAGGGFARVLREAKVADAMGAAAAGMHLPPLLYAWLVAAFIRVATGSSTVAITAAAGVMGPLLASHPELNRELLVISIGCGSLFLSHLNDGGFWIVKESLGLTVGQTLRTWTVTETIIGLAGLGFTLLVNALL
jgi:GntP family gluconate:H+ symporter